MNESKTIVDGVSEDVHRGDARGLSSDARATNFAGVEIANGDDVMPPLLSIFDSDRLEVLAGATIIVTNIKSTIEMRQALLRQATVTKTLLVTIIKSTIETGATETGYSYENATSILTDSHRFLTKHNTILTVSATLYSLYSE